jgi:NADH-quinone oxidoreductase subunit G
VGALNSKPFRYQGRSWEMTQSPLIAPHDGLGTNLFGHVLRGRLKRVVPRDNDAVNETWIADRERFSYEGLLADDRLTKPRLREGGVWREVDWETALGAAARGLAAAGPSTGLLAHPSLTLEELHLASRVARGLGSANLDHRLRQRDFRGDAHGASVPALGLPLEAVDALSGLLVIGSHLRAELPLLAHRVRKAAVRARAQVTFFDLAAREYRFPVAAQIVAAPADWMRGLVGLLSATAEVAGVPSGAAFSALTAGVTPSEADRAAARALCTGSNRAVWLGAMALRHPAYAELQALAAEIARLAGATLGTLAEGGNAVGAALAAVTPQGGDRPGLDALAMLRSPQRAYLLVGAIEPRHDLADPAAAEAAFAGAACVVAITPYASEELLRHAHVLLPMAAFAETSGTYVNLEGRWQSHPGAIAPPGEARPGWKILRVLGNLLQLPGFDYESSEQVRDELRARLDAASSSAAASVRPTAVLPATLPAGALDAVAQLPAAVLDVPMYAIDAILRRSPALQATTIARAGAEA